MNKILHYVDLHSNLQQKPQNRHVGRYVEVEKDNIVKSGTSLVNEANLVWGSGDAVNPLGKILSLNVCRGAFVFFSDVHLGTPPPPRQNFGYVGSQITSGMYFRVK